MTEERAREGFKFGFIDGESANLVYCVGYFHEKEVCRHRVPIHLAKMPDDDPKKEFLIAQIVRDVAKELQFKVMRGLD